MIRMKKDRENFWARSIGHCLAHLQNGVDDICEWGFKTMRSTGEAPDPKMRKGENKYLYGARRAGKGALSFLGNVGDSFYDKYGELKKDDRT